jgi:hypothetical protein
MYRWPAVVGVFHGVADWLVHPMVTEWLTDSGHEGVTTVMSPAPED